MASDLPPPVKVPAGYVSAHALAFGGVEAAARFVDLDSPLPTQHRLLAATSTPLTGTATTGSSTAGPFTPQLARPIWVTLSGTWAGTVQLLRSADAGATRLPVTYPDGSARGSWSGNVNAAVTEESDAAASYYLSVTLTSGTLTYRVAQ